MGDSSAKTVMFATLQTAKQGLSDVEM